MKNNVIDSSATLHEQLNPLLSSIGTLPIYREIQSVNALQIFMEHHVFAVWDFMCLLKTLYGKIVSTSPLWLPPADGLSSHLIGGILVEEESDVTSTGDYASHFETYLQAMKDIEANTQPITTFMQNIARHNNMKSAMHLSLIPLSAKYFMQSTFSVFDGEAHEVAAAFVFGREAITGTMFYEIVKSLQHHMPSNQQKCLSTLLYYLERHIELDSDDHFPKALKMLDNLCGQDQKKWQQAEKAATFALRKRIDFFTDIYHTMRSDLAHSSVQSTELHVATA